MKKIISAILILCLMLSSTVINAYSLDSIDTNIPNVAIDIQINKLLSYYYDSLIGEQPEPYSNICIENENTLFFKKFVEFDSSAKNMANCGITTYHFDYEYINFSESITSASASISADFYFTYEDRTAESAIGNIIYNFTFDKVNNKWYISSIDTDFDGFVRVEKVTEDNPNLTMEELFANEIQAIEENLAYEANIAVAYETGTFVPIEIEEESIIPLSTSYAYDADRAAAWASAHALDGDTSSAYFNYVYDEYGKPINCTNFVSQCVWVGYGGHLANGGNIIQNILNDVRMVPGSSGWYGCPRGYNDTSSNWSNVSFFWDYVTSSPSIGPRGTGYNNGYLYTYISAFSISEGCVLQLRRGLNSSNNEKYQHSIIVSDVQRTGMMSTSYDKIFVCANSTDRKDVKLKSIMIDNMGGSNCYMRMITFQSGNFNS